MKESSHVQLEVIYQRVNKYMILKTNVNGVKVETNNFELLFQEIENIIKGKDCNVCHGKGSYLVANGEDDQDWEYCQH